MARRRICRSRQNAAIRSVETEIAVFIPHSHDFEVLNAPVFDDLDSDAIARTGVGRHPASASTHEGLLGVIGPPRVHPMKSSFGVRRSDSFSAAGRGCRAWKSGKCGWEPTKHTRSTGWRQMPDRLAYAQGRGRTTIWDSPRQTMQTCGIIGWSQRNRM